MGSPVGKRVSGSPARLKIHNAAHMKSLPPLARKTVTCVLQGTPGHSFALGKDRNFWLLALLKTRQAPKPGSCVCGSFPQGCSQCYQSGPGKTWQVAEQKCDGKRT